MRKNICILGLFFIFSVSPIAVYAIVDLEKVTISNPMLANAFGTPLDSSITVEQQIQIAADITNNQEKSQQFNYLVQIKNENGVVEKLSWTGGVLNKDQKWNTSTFWSPQKAGEYIAEIYVWEDFPIDHKALTENTTISIKVS
ncbi:MAG: hypothetical protein IS860_04415 [Nitrosopumilus sp.]|nr:hypothetical protein [Nitrosopumilus sp.]